MEEIILDTNILIEILKNNKDTIKVVNQYEIHIISEISKMELFYGSLDKRELIKLNKFVSIFNIVPINESISNIASDLIFKYANSHKLDIPDSLIAATALYHNKALFTYNVKDFRYIENIKLVD